MSHRRSVAGAGSVGVQLSLIVTPMLDMSFQILAFFIMTYHPSALEGHIPGSLVPPESVAKKSDNPNIIPTTICCRCRPRNYCPNCRMRSPCM